MDAKKIDLSKSQNTNETKVYVDILPTNEFGGTLLAETVEVMEIDQ